MSSAAPTVVVGYDGSLPARAAIRHAVRMAGDGRVVIVHAHQAAPEHLAERWRTILEADHEARGHAVLDAILLEGNDELADADWEARLEPGAPADAILRVAREVGADGIVVGSHGYGPLSALLGSVSQALVRKADRPVTIIPPGAAASA